VDKIRRAVKADAGRIAEIEVFNYRLNFYPIFRSDAFYFGDMQVEKRMAQYREKIESVWVYDDGVVKGFIQVEGKQVKKLFVEPVLQGQGIGAVLLRDAIQKQDVQFLWALEKNTRAITFYARNGFEPTGERKLEEGTAEYLIKLARNGEG